MSRLRLVAIGLVLAVLLPGAAQAQRVVSKAERVISVSKGASALLINPVPIQRFSVGDPGVAEAVVLSPTEVLINGKSLGTTTLLIWDQGGEVKVNSVEVTADAPGLQRFIKQLMPDEDITVSASGNTVTLSGNAKDPNSVDRAVDIARGTGATVIDNLVAPPAVQVMLRVRFAEINRTALLAWAAQFHSLNPQDLNGGSANYVGDIASSSGDNTIHFLMSNLGANFETFVRLATQKGDLRTLSEPNLMTLPSKEATFLAGGEFPYPSVQTGNSNSVSIAFKEFGIRLKFTPNIQRNGAIRLKVAPEVSSLDFANAVQVSGFILPALRTRRAETDVELRQGQYLMIAGLLDNETTRNLTKIPLLGDIPILGELFKSHDIRDRRTELLVVVTPELVQASDSPPAMPTNEPGPPPPPGPWKRQGFLKSPPSSSNSSPLQGQSPQPQK